MSMYINGPILPGVSNHVSYRMPFLRVKVHLDLHYISALSICNETESICIAERTDAFSGMRPLADSKLPKSDLNFTVWPMHPCCSTA